MNSLDNFAHVYSFGFLPPLRPFTFQSLFCVTIYPYPGKKVLNTWVSVYFYPLNCPFNSGSYTQTYVKPICKQIFTPYISLSIFSSFHMVCTSRPQKNLVTDLYLSLEHFNWFAAILNSLKTNIFFRIRIIFTTNQFQTKRNYING